MLESEITENHVFEDILREAREKLPELCPIWTNYNPADSANALLELFAFMTEAQRFHVEQLGKSHELAFLHLLGVQPQGRKPAEVYVQISGTDSVTFLPRRYRVSAGVLAFETAKSTYLEQEGTLADRRETPFYPFGKNGRGVYDIQLGKKLSPKILHMLYFEVKEAYPVCRNRIVPEEFVPLTRLVMDYYDDEGRHPCRICEDFTYGLLQTGTITFEVGVAAGEECGAVAGREAGADRGTEIFLRLRAEGEYDTVPVLNDVSFNRISFVQRETKLECESYRLLPGEGNTLCIFADTRPAVDGIVCAYRQTEQGFQEIPISSSFLSGRRKYIAFEPGRTGTNAGGEIWLVSACPEIRREDFCFVGNGLPNQEYFLPADGILGNEFRLWVEESPGYYMLWNNIPDLAGAGKTDRVYHLDEEKGIIRFGDGGQGMMPHGRIEVIACAVCAGSGGNVQGGQICGSRDENGSCDAYWNPSPAFGGKDAESEDECLQRYMRNREVRESAVTTEDYEEVIRRTPGLRIRRVKVFPAADRENGLDAMVQPYTDGRQMLKGRAYEENIMRAVHKRRLLGTSVSLKWPEYVTVFLQLEVRVRSRYPKADREIRKRIFEYFEEHMDFGTAIVYSRLFGYIDMLPEVVEIRAMEIRAAGKGVSRDENRDIHLPVYGIARLDKVELSCIWTDEI